MCLPSISASLDWRFRSLYCLVKTKHSTYHFKVHAIWQTFFEACLYFPVHFHMIWSFIDSLFKFCSLPLSLLFAFVCYRLSFSKYWLILFAAYFHQAIAESGSALSGWAFDSKPEQHGKVIYCWSLFLFYFLISYWKDLTLLKRNSSLPQPPFSLYEYYCFLISMSPLDSHFPQDLLFTECFKTHRLSNWWYEQAGHLPQGSNIFLLLLFNFNTVLIIRS